MRTRKKIISKILISNKLKHNFLLKAVNPIISPQYLNRNACENLPSYTRKKEGYVQMYTLDDGTTQCRISDIRHTKSRRWIKRRTKRDLTLLKSLQKQSFNPQGGVFILNKNFVVMRAKLTEDFFIKTPLSFQIKARASYLSHTQTFFRSIKYKKYRFLYVLKPIKGGFKVYSSGALGFLRRRQGLLLFKKLARLHTLNTKRRWKLQIVAKAKNLFNFFAGSKKKVPCPIFCNQFTKFKLNWKISGFYRKRKFASIKPKRGRRRIRSKIKFIFSLFKIKKRRKFKAYNAKNPNKNYKFNAHKAQTHNKK